MLTEDERKRLMRLCLREDTLSVEEIEELASLIGRLTLEDAEAGQRLASWQAQRDERRKQWRDSETIQTPHSRPDPLFFALEEMQA
jgi:hypothetical protein